MEPNISRIKENLDDICKVSKFFDPGIYHPYRLNRRLLEEYLFYSHERLNVVQNKFEKLGFRAHLDCFEYKRVLAKNAIFTKSEKRKDNTWIIAHHDYCAGVGAEDNASALSTMIEIAEIISESKISENVVFASFDLEEIGLEGSKKYVKSLPRDELKSINAVIDLECLGSGKDISICKSVYQARSDRTLVSSIHKIADSLGYNFIPEDFDFFCADHVYFAKKKLKTVELCSLNHQDYLKYGGVVSQDRKDGSIAHTSQDLPENIKIENLAKITNVLLKFLKNQAPLY